MPSMPSKNINDKAEYLDKHVALLDNWWKNAPNDDDQIQAQIISTHYLVVAAYGIIESEMKRILCSINHTKLKKGFLKSVQNKHSWNFETIEKKLHQIDCKLSTQARKKLEEKHKDSITSLKNDRNKIAHGKNFPSGFAQSKDQFKNSIEGLHLISNIIDEWR